MKPFHFTTIRLRTHLALIRFGVSNSVVILVFAFGVVAWLCLFPYLHNELESQHQKLISMQKNLRPERLKPDSSPSVSVRRVQNFYQRLGDTDCTEQYVKTFYELAKKNNLLITQAEYTLNHQADGMYDIYRITLPLKGNYRSINIFSEQVLKNIPFASLDTISIKRDAITNSTLDVQLRFSLYLIRENIVFAQG